MPRLEEEYIDIHNAADVLEPKLQRRALNGLRRVQQVSPTIDEIALVLASQPPLSASKIMSRLFPSAPIKEALQRMAEPTIRAYNRGGHIGAKQLK